MSNSTQLCCTTNIISPYTGVSNSFCCSIVAPITTNPVTSGSTCSTVDCSSYAPVCFTVSGIHLCDYLQGIDAKLCLLGTSLNNITCAQITMTGKYGCIFPPTVSQTGMNLCTWAAQVNNVFCRILSALQGGTTSTSSTGTTSTNTVSNNTIIDGNNGTLSTTTGISSTNGIVSTTSTNTHGTSSTNVTIASSNPVISATLNTTSNIALTANNIYEIKAFVYVGAGSPGSAVLGITVNGSGTQRQIQTVNTGTQSGWQQMITQFTPSSNQNVTLTIGGTGFTSGTLAFADMTMQPIPAINSGGYYEYQVPYIDDIGKTYNNTASNFAASLNYSTSGLFITVGSDTLVMNGKTIYTTQQVIGFPSATTYYVFYDSWTDTYVYKTTNVADATQLLIYTIVTNGSVVTSKTISVPVAPFSGSNIQALSITAANIATATITASKLVNSGVMAGNYGDTTNSTHSLYLSVNAQGLVIGVTAVAINFPVTSVNGSTGVVSLGISNMNDATITTPSSGQFLKWNGTKWVNATITPNYYQTIYSSLTGQTQRPGLNFNGYFTLTDDSINNVTTVSITTSSLGYDRIQNTTGGNVLLGNSTGSAGAISEQGVTTDLLLSSGQLSVNYVINKQNTATYPSVATDFTGQTIIECQYSVTGAMTINLPTGSGAIPIGRGLMIKDISGAAATHNITIVPNIAAGQTIDGANSLVISTNYGKTKIYWDGTQWYTI